MKTPSDFYNAYLGRVVDYDGAYGPQCVDAFKVFCAWAGVPVKATPNNWADGYWYYRDSLGYASYFDYVLEDFQDGDWVIWAQRSASHPSSHIAMYYHGEEFSENQGGNGGFSLKPTNFQDALGALRWKGWANMIIGKGYHHYDWNGIGIDAILASTANGFKLHYISAEDNPNVGLSYAVKDIMEFDSDKLAIVGAINANYFQMADGMHLGCEGDGWTGGYFQAPKKAGIISYYITKDGTIAAHDQSGFYLGLDDIQMVCAPYSVLIHQGRNVYMRSESFGDKDYTKNTQSAAMKIGDDWCLARFSSCYPSDVLQFASDCNANELILMDSGGSAQMFECATTGKRKAVVHTGRKISGVLVLAQEIDGNHIPTTPDPEPVQDPEPTEPSEPVVEPEPVEPEPVVDPNPEPTEPIEETPSEEVTGIFGMSNKVYDILKYIAQIGLPALCVLITTLGETWGLSDSKKIAETIMAIDLFLGAILQVSTNVYKKNLEGNNNV